MTTVVVETDKVKPVAQYLRIFVSAVCNMQAFHLSAPLIQ